MRNLAFLEIGILFEDRLIPMLAKFPSFFTSSIKLSETSIHDFAYFY